MEARCNITWTNNFWKVFLICLEEANEYNSGLDKYLCEACWQECPAFHAAHFFSFAMLYLTSDQSVLHQDVQGLPVGNILAKVFEWLSGYFYHSFLFFALQLYTCTAFHRTALHAGISNKFTAKLACAVCAQCRCRIQGFCVWDLILPSDVKQTNQAVHKELVELPGVSGVDVENADTSGLLWWGSYLFIRCEADRRGSS